MASRYGQIVEILAQRIANVDQINNVYAQELYAANRNDFMTKFKTTFGLTENVVQGWWFCIKKVETFIEEFDAETEVYPIQLYGMLSLNTDNGSEERMINLVQGIRAAINDDLRLALPYYYDMNPAELVSLDDMVYGSGGAVHFAELHIRVTFKVPRG